MFTQFALGQNDLIVGFLVSTGYMPGDLGTLILGILSILAGGTAVATDKVLGTRNSVGQRQL